MSNYIEIKKRNYTRNITGVIGIGVFLFLFKCIIDLIEILQVILPNPSFHIVVPLLLSIIVIIFLGFVSIDFLFSEDFDSEKVLVKTKKSSRKTKRKMVGV